MSDTGADISLLKGNKLIGTTEYDPVKKVKVKCVHGSPMETHGVLEAKVELSNSWIVHDFQLVNKHVDIPRDRILGRDFLKRAKANFAMNRKLNLNGEACKMVGETKQLGAREPCMRKTGHIKLPTRAESIVSVPVTPGSPLVRMTNKCEIQEGVILAASLNEGSGGLCDDVF